MNLRCDCISCKYENQKSTEDPCYRCYNDSEYVYTGFVQKWEKDHWMPRPEPPKEEV